MLKCVWFLLYGLLRILLNPVNSFYGGEITGNGNMSKWFELNVGMDNNVTMVG